MLYTAVNNLHFILIILNFINSNCFSSKRNNSCQLRIRGCTVVMRPTRAQNTKQAKQNNNDSNNKTIATFCLLYLNLLSLCCQWQSLSCAYDSIFGKAASNLCSSLVSFHHALLVLLSFVSIEYFMSIAFKCLYQHRFYFILLMFLHLGFWKTNFGCSVGVKPDLLNEWMGFSAIPFF